MDNQKFLKNKEKIERISRFLQNCTEVHITDIIF